MYQGLDWDDARLFLAVVREGSLRAAGRKLGLSQPTVGRKLARFEAAMRSGALFDRLPEGLRLTPAGGAVVPFAERLEDAAIALERRQLVLSESWAIVRISVGEWAGGFLAHCLSNPEATQRLPERTTIELVESDEAPSLTRRAADIAVRHGRPETGDLYAARVGVIACAAYRSSQRMPPRNSWITYAEAQAHYAVSGWITRRVQKTGATLAARASRLDMQVRAARAGAGSAVLPCYVGDGDPGLSRVHDRIPELDADHWLIVHRDLRRLPRIRAVASWVKHVFDTNRPILQGLSGGR